MGFRVIVPKRIKKVRSKNSQEVLDRLQRYLEDTDEPVEILCRFWEDQKDAVTYKELRDAVSEGVLSNEMIRLWTQDYAVLVAGKFKDTWTNAIAAGPKGQPVLDGISDEIHMQSPGILSWISERGADFVTASTQEQKDAVAALLTKKMREQHTVDELARMIRPCIGLTEGQAKANARYYDNIITSLKKDHPRMKPDSIRRKAQEAAQKYAEKQHRYRAMVIARTESAFAYNWGAEEGVRQAQEEGYIGKVVKKWCTSGDDSVCPVCAALDGVVIGMDAGFGIKGQEIFPGQHMLPPAHPSCACAVEYIEEL